MKLLSSLLVSLAVVQACCTTMSPERTMLACRAMCGGVEVEIHSVTGGVCKCQDRRVYIPVTEDFN